MNNYFWAFNMEFRYDRENIPGVSDDVLNEFYNYVDVLLELISVERVNPYNNIPYCPNNDATFEFEPRGEKIFDDYGVEKHKFYYSFHVQYTLPCKLKVDEPPRNIGILIHVNQNLTFNQEKELIKNDFEVGMKNSWIGYSVFWMHMMTKDLRDIEEIQDGMRIFLATFMNFYVYPYNPTLQLDRDNLMKRNYQERHNKYLDFIRNERPSRREQMIIFLGRFGRTCPSDVFEHIKDGYLRYENDLMREVTSQGVA